MRDALKHSCSDFILYKKTKNKKKNREIAQPGAVVSWDSRLQLPGPGWSSLSQKQVTMYLREQQESQASSRSRSHLQTPIPAADTEEILISGDVLSTLHGRTLGRLAPTHTSKDAEASPDGLEFLFFGVQAAERGKEQPWLYSWGSSHWVLGCTN